MSQPDLRYSAGTQRINPVQIEVDGQSVVAYEGETIAVALLAAGKRLLHKTKTGAPRGVYCGMGLCNGCLVLVNGVPNMRACMTLVQPDLKIETQEGAGRKEEEFNEDR